MPLTHEQLKTLDVLKSALRTLLTNVGTGPEIQDIFHQLTATLEKNPPPYPLEWEIAGIRTTDRIDLSGIKCPIKLIFSRVTFSHELSLTDCDFQQNVLFKSSTFQAGVKIASCTFQSLLEFDGSQFSVNSLQIHKSKLKLAIANTHGIQQLEVEDSDVNEFRVPAEQTISENISFKDSRFFSEISTGGVFFSNQGWFNAEGCTFFSKLTLHGGSRKGSTSFKKAKFKKRVVISAIDFSGLVDFTQSEFHEGIHFNSVHSAVCKFQQPVLFNEVLFYRGKSPDTAENRFHRVQATADLSFKNVKFTNRTTFDDSSFHGVDFTEATFDEQLIVDSIDLNILNFEKATFSKYVKIHACTVRDFLNFRKCTSEMLDLADNRFLCNSDFSEIESFDLVLSGCTFGKSFICETASVHELNATSAKFESRTSFSKTSFANAPLFHDAELFQDTNFYSAKFLDVQSPGAEASYRTLKQKLSQLHNDAEEQLFAALELHSRRKRIENTFPTKLKSILHNFPEYMFSLLYYLSNNYGRSLFLPLVWIALIGAVLTPYYGSHFNIIWNPKVRPDQVYQTWVDALGRDACLIDTPVGCLASSYGIYFSAFNSLGPLRLLESYNVLAATNSITQAVALLQGISSTVFIYLFIVGIKRRFKTLS